MSLNLKNQNAIIRPRVTEKGSLVNSANVYTFEVTTEATKKDIAREVNQVYKVKPIKVNITKNPGKQVMHKGMVGRTRGVKKAYVYLKEGDKIEF
ncbi:MAG TPA: 50S ribosomal protein L23 [Candidatus Paceibacterota bacterium]|nr:50S ribosomal protein L23 [Candidatus Paceibacterota bacterium]